MSQHPEDPEFGDVMKQLDRAAREEAEILEEALGQVTDDDVAFAASALAAAAASAEPAVPRWRPRHTWGVLAAVAATIFLVLTLRPDPSEDVGPSGLRLGEGAAPTILRLLGPEGFSLSLAPEISAAEAWGVVDSASLDRTTMRSSRGCRLIRSSEIGLSSPVDNRIEHT